MAASASSYDSAFLLETIEGLLYSTFPDCEIHETKDYTTPPPNERFHVVGTSLKLQYFDIYPIKGFEEFKEDSQSGLFSVISKVPNPHHRRCGLRGPVEAETRT